MGNSLMSHGFINRCQKLKLVLSAVLISWVNQLV